MNTQKLNKVVGLGMLVVSVGLSSSVAYANTTNVKEMVSENFIETTTYSNDLFLDVKGTEWFISGVSSAVNLSLMQGETSDRFNPNGNITVAQTIAVASRIHALYETGSLEELNSYTGAKWYSGVEKYALEKGIIKVDDFSVEDMNNPATRADLCYILDGSLPQKEITTQVNNNLQMSDVKDLNSTIKYADTVLKHMNAGIITGYEDGSVKPTNRITRAEASVIITRLVKPSTRMEVKVQAPVTTGRTVYVRQVDEYGIQQVYDKPGAGLTAINVKYGRHTYNCNNQKEYDFVVSEIEKILKFEGTGGKEYKQLLEDYKTDKNKTHYKAMDNAYRLGIKEENKILELYKVEKACAVARTLSTPKSQKGDSAYSLMKNGEGDCTSDAMVNSAVMDIMGYNSKTVASDSQNHEWVMMEYDGKWLHLPSAGFVKTREYNRNTTNDTFNNEK